MIVRKNRKKLRAKALFLRRRGFTYKEIIETLHIAKSTLSDWVNSGLTQEEEKEIRKITTEKGKRKVVRINKERSLKIQKIEKEKQKKYADQICEFDKEKLFWLGMGLYLAEGAKTDRWKATFYNSNPSLNKIMIRFFREICKVPDKRIHIQLVLHENISEKKTRKYWSKLLKVPESHFYKASYVKSRASKGKRPKYRLPYGTIQLSISGKETTNKIRGWILGIKRKFAGIV